MSGFEKINCVPKIAFSEDDVFGLIINLTKEMRELFNFLKRNTMEQAVPFEIPDLVGHPRLSSQDVMKHRTQAMFIWYRVAVPAEHQNLKVEEIPMDSLASNGLTEPSIAPGRLAQMLKTQSLDPQRCGTHYELCGT